ncbi:Bug family tripartite tricarboxylate transporter substrate binding protein [Verticiella sediminum]|nr:tripartite tricarboxylate transporter substrate binding protein [Verticiella sediminum]
MKISTYLRVLALVLLQSFSAMPWGNATAAEFPSKPIRLITPYAAGGSTDTLARIVGPKMSEALGVPVVVEAMPGANGAMALSHLAKSAPDGYTMLITTASPIVVNPHTFPNVPYDPLKDFTHISLVARSEAAFLVNPSIPANSLQQLIDLSKTRPIRIGVAGAGGQPELILAKINTDSGAQFDVIPYNGGGPAIIDAVAGHVDGVLNDIAGNVGPMVKAGKLRSVAVLTSNDKSAMLPGAATLANQSLPTQWELRNWLVLLGPANMPPAISEKLRKLVSDVVADTGVIENLKTGSMVPFASESTAEAHEFITNEYMIFRDIQKQTGVKVE